MDGVTVRWRVALLVGTTRENICKSQQGSFKARTTCSFVQPLQVGFCAVPPPFFNPVRSHRGIPSRFIHEFTDQVASECQSMPSHAKIIAHANNNDKRNSA